MTQQEAIITITFDDRGEKRQLAFSDVRQIIAEYLNAANFVMAASVSTQLADQRPQDLWPQFVAAESLFLHQEIEAAFQYIDRALEIHPGHLASLVLKSRLYGSSEDSIQAVQVIDTALSLEPGDSQLHGVKAELLVDAGQIEGARNSFLKSIGLEPRNTEALLGLAQLPGDNFDEELLKKVELMIDSRQLTAESQIKAHFALAHAHDRKADFSSHFSHLNAGNALKNQQLKFDPDAAEHEAQGIIELFSKDFFARHRAKTGNPANIIFIIGFPRCGSTLVEQILSSHPAVAAAGETYALKHAIRDFQCTKNLPPTYPYWIAGQPVESFIEMADDYLFKVKNSNQRDYLTDKLLDNYKFVGMIHLMFPEATIINVQRNPIDICYSCYKHLFHLGSLPFTYSLENLARQFRAYQALIRHWHNVLPGIIYTMQYEQLVTRQEEITRGLLNHCGLPWNDACLNFHLNARTVQTNSNTQVRQPLYADSVNRWKVCKEYLGPLLALGDCSEGKQPC